ncbi:hypothetical protein PENSPDRAFT_662302 [Peniophora sp. CONT]|nr:hypothetical protein PENSPDRAFT_662302 [Peniophora sp. CONT]
MICKLPNEMLCVTFEHLREIWPMCPTQEARRLGATTRKSHIPLGWVIATHVCQRWRHVAIQHRLLWTTLGFDFLDSWVTFLVRSGPTTPVAIQDAWSKLGGKPSGYLLREHVVAMNEHAHRIGSVVAVVEVEVLKELWSGLATTPSSLTYLELHVDPSDPALEEQPLHVHLALMLQHSPKLRVLNLNSTSAVHLDWSFQDGSRLPLANVLRTLRLNIPCASTTRHSDVLRSLQGLGTLTELEVREYTTLPFVAISSTMADDIDGEAPMPSLRRLSFINCSESSLALWKHLDTSDIKHLFIQMVDLDNDWLAAFLSLVGEFFQTRERAYTSLYTSWGSEERRVDFKLQSEDGSRVFDLVLESDTNTDTLVHEMLIRTPMATLRSLTLDAFDEAGSSFSIEDISNMFRGAKDMRSLTISGDILCPKMCAYLAEEDTSSVCDLDQDETAADPDQGFPFLFPLLAHLDIGSDYLSFFNLSHRWMLLPPTTGTSPESPRDVWWHFESR